MIVYLADLAHDYLPARQFVPLGIGYLASYSNSIFGEKVEFHLFKSVDRLLDKCEACEPDLVGFANYTWNERLNAFAGGRLRKRFPELPIVMGGILRYSSALTENDYSFIPGYQLDAVAMSYWQTKQIFKGIPQFSLIGQKKGVDHWEGDVAPNSGGFILQGAAGLMWNLGQQHFTLSVRVPLYQALNMVNEGSPVDNDADMWGFSVSYRTVLTLGDK